MGYKARTCASLQLKYCCFPSDAYILMLHNRPSHLKQPGLAPSNAEHVFNKLRFKWRQMSACKHSGNPLSTEFISMPFVYVQACWKYSSKRCRNGFGIWKIFKFVRNQLQRNASPDIILYHFVPDEIVWIRERAAFACDIALCPSTTVGWSPIHYRRCWRTSELAQRKNKRRRKWEKNQIEIT